MTNPSEKVFQKIQQSHLKPKPRWHFLLHRGYIMGMLILSIFLGSFSFAIIIYQFSGIDWNIFTQLSDNLWRFIFLALPYFWLLFIVAFSFLITHYFHLTDKGHRYSASVIISISLLLSILGGIAIYKTGLPALSDKLFYQRVPLYRQMNRLQERWLDPEEGRLGGIIIKIQSDELLIKDLQRNDWRVDISEIDIPPSRPLEIGLPSRFIGEMIADQYFLAHEIHLGMEPGSRFQEFPFHFRQKMKENLPPPRINQ